MRIRSMCWLAVMLLGTALGTSAVPPALAAELALTDDQIDDLGITLAAPRPATATARIAARGRVVIPPAGDVAVSAAHEGLVVRVLRATGDRVAAGDVLADIASSDFLDAQRAFLDALSADHLARRRLVRDRQLVAEGIVSQRRLEQTQAEAEAAAAALSEHRQMLRIGGLDAGTIDSLGDTRELLALLPVQAPVGGVVLEVSGRVGSGAAPSEPLFRLGDLSTLWLEMQVPQQRLETVAEGMPVVVAAGAAPVARVVAIGGAVDPATQMVTVRAELTAADHGLRPGQFVAVDIIGEAGVDVGDSVWSVPAASVVQAGSGHFVFVRTEAGFAVAPVHHVGAAGERALVAGELDPGARLASAGVAALKSLWGGPAAGEG